MTYIIEIDTDENLSQQELDELRQAVIDYVTPESGTSVSIMQID